MRIHRIKNAGFVLLALGLLITTTISISMSYPNKVLAGGPGTNYLASQSASGAYPNAYSQSGAPGSPKLSSDGRYVAFSSQASNLVPNDTNGYNDVFVKDTQTGVITRASLYPSGAQLPNDAYVQDMSYDGRYVLFALMPSGALFVRDTLNNTTASVSNNSGPCQVNRAWGGAISADGRYVTYSDSNYQGNPAQAVVKDMSTGACRVLSTDSSGNVGNADSTPGGISCDGGVISFYTQSNNLPGGSGGYIARFDTSGNLVLTKVPMERTGSTVSCNGNVLATWDSGGAAYTINRLTGQQTILANQTHSILGSSAGTRSVSLSDDGRYAAIMTNVDLDPSHPNTGAYISYDAYVTDIKNGTNRLLSFTVAGNKSGSANGGIGISADGNKVAYGYYTPPSSDTAHELISGLTTGTSNQQEDVYTSETGY